MKIPVFPNWYPYNEMLLDKRLQVGEYAVKTRSWNWSYRGRVLLYTSGRTARQAVDAYKYQSTSADHKVIVGIADLVETRPLTNAEAKKMVCNFNNITPQTLNKILKDLGLQDDPDGPFLINSPQDYWFLVAPFRNGFFFKNVKRFQTPVPFKWPAGPVKPIYIQTARYPRLHAEILTAKFSSQA